MSAPPVVDRSGLWYRIGDTIAIQRIQFEANQRLTVQHPFSSVPQHWPWLRRGISFWQNLYEHRQVYLIGNPMVFWMCLTAMCAYPVLACIHAIRLRRGCRDMDAEQSRKFVWIAEFLLLGYAMHYVPFFAMERQVRADVRACAVRRADAPARTRRQLFLHHYMPAHLFAILACAALFDHCTRRYRPWVRTALVAMLCVTVAGVFAYFSPLTYATPMPPEASQRRRWLATWDFV